ncbi:MAG TPA: adenylate/guanylate cyclase domain-containing protein [Anaerolineae bacterium]|nr:adenylate/guanylate cyclase domain-containing protein [Anaerolineae bacterium]HQJ51912.1 adenylate/guanylate cyclase domain-containing protein [Anaerolineae bacterium]
MKTSQILVVDDNKMNRLLLARGLEQQGHHVSFAENGRQALEMLRAVPYDLVLLDVLMPEMDGYQVLGELMADTELKNVPVIMVSAVGELDSVVRCIEMGAEDYLPKPINPVLLKARIGSSLEKKRLRDQQRELIRKFATKEVAEDLEASGFALGGKYVPATVMFSDIRGFTTISESQPPADTIELLNDYYTLMMDAITGESGVVNQIVGDGLMAIFGAPRPCEDRMACAARAALSMIELIEQYDQDRVARKLQPIRIGIGISSGDVIAGYTGTQQRATYTCVGDTVNQAARLEAYTKVAGRPILLDDATRDGLGDAFALEDLGEVEVKGKTRPVHVFALKGRVS